MKKFFNRFLSGLMKMLWGIGATASFLTAIDFFQKTSFSKGWIAVLCFFTAVTSMIVFVIIVSILGDKPKKVKIKNEY